MNILIVNGSPRGLYSTTLQSVLYLETRFPEPRYIHLHAAQRIRALEKDFSEAAEALARADLIVFAYPVYTFIAPSQLARFIELLKASGVDLRGKFATQLTTSKHFYDTTAHAYVQQNAQDLGLKFIRGLSADMEDLLKPEGREQLEKFFRYVQWCISEDICESAPELLPAGPVVFARPARAAAEPAGGDVAIVTNCADDDAALASMIARFRAVLGRKSRVLNLREHRFKGGCLGCFGCAADGKCVYDDGFDDFLRNGIQRAEAVVYAFTIRDHAMGADFKQFDDRQFCNGHRTVTEGMPVGYLVCGDWRREDNLRLIVAGRAEVGGNYLAGVATGEREPDAEIDRLAATLNYAIENRYRVPRGFLGVGGMKIFRDLIYLMRGMMRADHRFYKAHALYDFPQKRPGTILKMYLAGALIASPRLKKKIGNRLNEGMIAPYRRVIEAARPKDGPFAGH